MTLIFCFKNLTYIYREIVYDVKEYEITLEGNVKGLPNEKMYIKIGAYKSPINQDGTFKLKFKGNSHDDIIIVIEDSFGIEKGMWKENIVSGEKRISKDFILNR